MSHPNVSAVILAAGFSRRMGFFKPLAPLNGTTVIERSIRSAKAAGIWEIVVVTGYGRETLEPVILRNGAKPVFNSRFPEGMYSSVQAGAASLSPASRAFLILPADCASVRPSTIRLLAARASYRGIIHPVFLGERGHPPVIGASFIPHILTFEGEGGLRGFLDMKKKIAEARKKLDWLNDPFATEKSEELQAMNIACDASILFARRHADLAEKMAKSEKNTSRKEELLKIADVCRHVPAHAPRDFHEAIQTYWFTHLGTITELNGWDAMSPGHFDIHLAPFYEKGIREGTLDREKAKEIISCFWVKVNNTPAPPKVGVTAAESGTYNDFTQINLGGITEDGADGVSEVSYIMLDVLDELQLLQPQASVHISTKTPERFLKYACRVMRRGSGYPSAFNADAVFMEQLGMGKRVEDARTGGTSGCIETGSFGKEAYILHGYLNVPKILELTLNNGIDPLTGEKIGTATGDPTHFKDFEEFYRAFEKQLAHVVDIKIRTDNYIQRMFARCAPAPYLSVLIHDCIENGKDYYDGGPRYNTDYIQCCGIGTVTDSLSVLKKHIYEEGILSMDGLLNALHDNWKEHEDLRQIVWNKTPFFGNDDDYADEIMQRVYSSLIDTIDGRNSPKGPTYHVNMLSTTCHIYFGKKLGATPNGRFAHTPESDGTSPSHGADRHGPTAVVKSLSKMNQIQSGGTLLNQRFLPSVLKDDSGLTKMSKLVRTYFNLGGHHIQFNVVDTETLRKAQKCPDEYRGLLVRVAGYSDYFVDLDEHHQEEIIARTAQETF
jgi:pyruvate formate-lyase/glycerol dehydratase family glycyl radical enzyme